MNQETLFIFFGLVFGAVFLLAQAITIPTFGTRSHEKRELKRRLSILASESHVERRVSLIRVKYLRGLSPLEAKLESLFGMKSVEQLIELSGHDLPAYQLVLLSIFLGLVGGELSWIIGHQWWSTLAGIILIGGLPFMKMKSDSTKRFAKFEEQLPEALDAMTRALRAGYPFNETLNLVATGMKDPIASEFRITFDEINFGVDMRWALHNLVDRIPSMSLMAIVTTVLVQRETGGNLAETFENIAKIIRERFHFQRSVQIKTAEGRISALFLTASPLSLFGFLYIVNPDYMAPLIHEPLGKKLILVGVGLFIVGSLWIRNIISLDI